MFQLTLNASTRMVHLKTNAPISTGKRSKNSRWSSNSASNWLDKWTTKQSLKWEGSGDRWTACHTSTSIPCLTISQSPTLSTDRGILELGRGKTHPKSSTSWPSTWCKLRSMVLMFLFKTKLSGRKKKSRKEKMTWQSTSCTKWESQQPSEIDGSEAFHAL